MNLRIILLSFLTSLVVHSLIFVRPSVENSSVLTSFSSKKSSVRVSFREYKKQKKIVKSVKKEKGARNKTTHASTPKNLEVEQGSVEVKVLNKVVPKYPRKSRLFREEGVVLLRIQINKNGMPISSELLSSSGYNRLDQAAREAALASEYVSATSKDRVVESHIELEFKFELTE